MLSYATAHDAGNSDAVIQTDVLLTTHALPAAGPVVGTAGLGSVYKQCASVVFLCQSLLGVRACEAGLANDGMLIEI